MFDLITTISIGGYVDNFDTRRGASELGQQEQSQKKMTEMVGLDLRLEAILGFLERAHHDARVVYQHMNISLSL